MSVSPFSLVGFQELSAPRQFFVSFNILVVGFALLTPFTALGLTTESGNLEVLARLADTKNVFVFTLGLFAASLAAARLESLSFFRDCWNQFGRRLLIVLVAAGAVIYGSEFVSVQVSENSVVAVLGTISALIYVPAVIAVYLNDTDFEFIWYVYLVAVLALIVLTTLYDWLS